MFQGYKSRHYDWGICLRDTAVYLVVTIILKSLRNGKLQYVKHTKLYMDLIPVTVLYHFFSCHSPLLPLFHKSVSLGGNFLQGNLSHSFTILQQMLTENFCQNHSKHLNTERQSILLTVQGFSQKPQRTKRYRQSCGLITSTTIQPNFL